MVISISHVWNLLRKEDVHLHTPALRIGTHFLLTLETVVFHFHLLSTTSKPFSSLSTRLAHAARLGFFYKKTRYINSLLLLLLFIIIIPLHLPFGLWWIWNCIIVPCESTWQWEAVVQWRGSPAAVCLRRGCRRGRCQGRTTRSSAELHTAATQMNHQHHLVFWDVLVASVDLWLGTKWYWAGYSIVIVC